MSRLSHASLTLLGSILSIAAGSCSLAIDVALDCTADSDCANQNTESSLYACVAGSCEMAMCEQDSDCDSLGEIALCEDGACVPAACAKDDDCQGQLDTPGKPVCNAGRCEDPQWGCIGRKDPRVPQKDRASFKVPLVDLLMNAPKSVEVTACLTPDVNCQSPRNISVDYDDETGMLEIAGKDIQDFGGYLKIGAHFTETVEYMEARFQFSTHDLIDDQESEDTIIMVLASLVPALGERAGIENASAERGVILSRMYDCQGQPAEGITLVSNDKGLADDAVIFYVVNDAYELSQDLSETTAVGVAGITNVLQETETPDLSINLEAYLGDTLIAPPFTAVMVPGGATHVWVFPGYE